MTKYLVSYLIETEKSEKAFKEAIEKANRDIRRKLDPQSNSSMKIRWVNTENPAEVAVYQAELLRWVSTPSTNTGPLNITTKSQQQVSATMGK